MKPQTPLTVMQHMDNPQHKQLLDRFWRKRPAIRHANRETITCAHCGHRFTVTVAEAHHRRYCSTVCYAEARRGRSRIAA